MWLLKVFVVLHLTAVYADTESESEYVTQSSQVQPTPTTPYVPPKPELKLRSAHTDVFSSEKVELKCNVDGSSDWKFIWKKDGKELQYSESLSLSEETSLLIITAETRHAGDYTCTGEHKTRSVSTDPSGSIKITVNDPPTPTLKLLSGWLNVFATEKVALSCEVSSPDWTLAWYKDGVNLIDDSILTIKEKGTLLNINSASQTHQGQYGCRAQLTSRGVSSKLSNTVDLKVYANKPKPTMTRSSNFNTMYPGESISFTCALSLSTGWVYVWYHNGTETPASSDGTYNIAKVGHSHSGTYHCKAKRGSVPFYTEASETMSLQVSDPPTPTLKLLSGWLDVFENEKVALSCEVSSPDWTLAWYKDGVNLIQDSVLTIKEKGTLLNINSASQTHQGQYGCKAQLTSRGVSSKLSNTVDLKVYSNKPKPIVTRSSNFNTMYPGESINFKCAFSVSTGWVYVWYHDGTENPASSDGTYNIAKVGHSHSGTYHCKAKRGSVPFYTEASETTSLQVSDPPAPTLTQLSSWLDVFLKEKVALSCELSGPEWTFTWYKDGVILTQDSVLTINERGTSLNVTSASQTHQGQYGCKAQLTSRGVSSKLSNTVDLKVYNPPTPTLTQLSSWLDVFENENVALSCEVRGPEWTFAWYKNGVNFTQDSVRNINEKGTLLNVTSVSQTHQGKYGCKAQLKSRGVISELSNTVDVTVYQNVPVPALTKSPAFDPMYVGETVTFTCHVDLSTGWNYQWYKDGKERAKGKEIKVHLSLGDRGEYSCKASRGAKTTTEPSKKIQQNVHEIPVSTLKPLTQWLDVFPGESMKMSCEMSEGSGWLYTWREGVVEIKGDNTMYNVDGHTLSIGNASAMHHGVYSCSGKLKDRSVTSNFSSEVRLHVYDTTPSVTLMQDPEASTLHTEDFVSFSCHINVSSGWDYLWYKDYNQLTTKHSGNYHNITSAVTTDTGSYKCQVKRGVTSVFKSEESPTVKLNIEERPGASITLQTGWAEAFSTDSLVLKCKVTDDNMWNFTWFREGKEIDLAISETYLVTPENDPDQGQYTCKGIRNERPFHSRVSAFFKTKNLLLKRRILLSISGCLFFGIIAVFLGCIFLKIFRKPADNEEKLEENDLFVSMKLKDSTDAPCPLVEFITDASIKAASKDVEENGAICSETTPLPITSQEDQALISDNHGSTENGGGLVSFKQ